MRLWALTWVLLLLWSTRREAQGVCPELQRSGFSQAAAVHLDRELSRWLARLRSHIAEFTAMAGPPPLLCLQGSLHSLLFDLRYILYTIYTAEAPRLVPPLSDGALRLNHWKPASTVHHCGINLLPDTHTM